jgi:hypothetical protein
MTRLRRLDEFLRAEDGDGGCTAGEDILDAYVELAVRRRGGVIRHLARVDSRLGSGASRRR